MEDSNLQQGDIFRAFPVPLPRITPEILHAFLNDEEVDAPVEVLRGDVIFLTQSCDLANEKVDTVILCNIWNLSDHEVFWDQTRKR